MDAGDDGVEIRYSLTNVRTDVLNLDGSTG